MALKHAMNSIKTEVFLNLLFSQNSIQLLGYYTKIINCEIYEFSVTVEYRKRLNVTTVIEKFQARFYKHRNEL